MTRADFHILFEKLYSPLWNYAYKIVNDHDEAEDIVQGIFVEFWNKQGELNLSAQPDHYLIRAVKFKCLDYQRRAIVKRKYEAEIIHTRATCLEPLAARRRNRRDLPTVGARDDTAESAEGRRKPLRSTGGFALPS